ncbi:S4 domain-containing protein, partial [Bradyrhizobium sp. NBAIM08]|uniref:pseudouridine synthase n=1 Tax=Bradyrhizobium sp. NBAIM08 TaxID=2793815 RepID=UPI00201BEE76
APGSMRLSKRMSELGLASRREADEWIAKGWVRVDDQVVSELGSRVVAEQRITIDARARFQQAQRVTVLVNKPVGYVSGQAEDGYEPAVVLVTPPNQWPGDRSGTRFLREHLKSLVPAGRLDIDSVGLLVLTQDGRVAKQLIGEDSEVEKEYL